MTTGVEIRRATAADAETVYEIVLRALRETNARDYPASVIDRLVLTLPEGVASKLGSGKPTSRSSMDESSERQA
jgi:hypothetical protein